ncbi:MAG: glycosyltransferase [Nocardioides sp.]
MRVSMLTCGTRGDTQPLAVLGAELRRRGHEVRIGASPNTLDLVRTLGFEALPLGPDSQQLMESPEGQLWLAAGNARAFTDEHMAISHASFPASVEERSPVDMPLRTTWSSRRTTPARPGPGVGRPATPGGLPDPRRGAALGARRDSPRRRSGRLVGGQ